MMEKTIKKEEFVTTKWTGGETTQLFIFPEEANFSKRDFLFRVSSATFSSTESQFSNFDGYQRYILPLEGNLKVFHKRLYNRDLNKYDVEYFDGGWSTFSKNTLDCRDYNFIVKSGYTSSMQILQKGDVLVISSLAVLTIFSVDDFSIELSNSNEDRIIEGFSLFLIETENIEHIKIKDSNSPVIVTIFMVK